MAILGNVGDLSRILDHDGLTQIITENSRFGMIPGYRYANPKAGRVTLSKPEETTAGSWPM